MTLGSSSNLGLMFSETAKVRPKPKTKTPAPVLSIRITPEERINLEREAGGRSLSSYVRSRLFDDGPRRRASSSRAVVSDHKALARVLGAMGRSPAIGTLKGVLAACDEGAILLGPEAEDALRSACATIESMRLDLLKALGLKPE